MACSSCSRILFQAKSEFNPWKPPNAPTKKPNDQKKMVSKPSKNTLGTTSPPGLGSFKPPKLGYGVRAPEKNVGDEEKAGMLEIVRNQSGKWHDRARIVWELQQMGFTAETLYDAALITPLTQTTMVVAAKVYESLVSAQASEELLSAFDDESQISSLYELRILSSKQRKAAAEFLIDSGLDTKGAEELARAIKQHERRAEVREEGFSPLPGDCLALMHYRAATESSVREEKKIFAEQALSFAASEAAIQKITQFLQEL